MLHRSSLNTGGCKSNDANRGLGAYVLLVAATFLLAGMVACDVPAEGTTVAVTPKLVQCRQRLSERCHAHASCASSTRPW